MITKPLHSLAAAALLACGTAHAATADLDNFQAQWQNSSGGQLVGVVEEDDTSRIRWGDPTTSAGQSGYDFTTAAPLMIDLDVDTAPFLLGTFSHVNNPISLDTEITSVELLFNLDVSIDGTPASNNPMSLVFLFQHDETANDIDPCANGGSNANGCADIVNVSMGFAPQDFDFGGVTYTINVLGFSTDGGVTIVDNFFTAENATSPAGLYATLSVATVPEAETYAMLLAGLGLVGYTVRRRRTVH